MAPSIVSTTAPVPYCPKCGAAMRDTRTTKRDPRAADWQCLALGCDGRIFAPRPDPVASAEPSAEPIDLDLFVRTSLDGATSDASFATQDDAIAWIEAALAYRGGRALTSPERVKVGIAVAVEWNRREQAQANEDRRRHTEWLAEYQQNERASGGVA